MKIELRNIKYIARASQETPCFQATVYIDKLKVGDVRNGGKGGYNRYNPHSLSDRLNAYAKTLPPIFDEIEIEQDADTVIGELLDYFLQQR